jgi:3-keto-5-aminohexanoate cleavage enzyme
MLFDNPVEKVAIMLKYMTENNILPECECVMFLSLRCEKCCCQGRKFFSRCFDTGIVRSVGMFQEAGMLKQPVFVSFVMGVASGMPADPDWLPLLIKLLKPGSNFQTIAIGRENVWPLLR